MPFFIHQEQRIAYTEYGDPLADRPVILIHGLLLSQLMDRPLAETLAARGNRVITIDLLGHGQSDRPRDMWRYSMTFFGEQVVGLMDHLGLDQAVVMGTSLGANTSLEIASAAPERLRGLVVEMPVLDNALLASALFFAPILTALTIGEPAMQVLSRLARLVPRSVLPLYGNVLLDLVRQDPGPSGAVLQGLFFGRTAPHRAERRTFTMPALVIGHHRDPVHPFSDAGQLADEMPNARLLAASSMLELRLSPERLTGEISGFLDEVWAAPPRRIAAPSPSRATSASGSAR